MHKFATVYKAAMRKVAEDNPALQNPPNWFQRNIIYPILDLVSPPALGRVGGNAGVTNSYAQALENRYRATGDTTALEAGDPGLTPSYHLSTAGMNRQEGLPVRGNDLDKARENQADRITSYFNAQGVPAEKLKAYLMDRGAENERNWHKGNGTPDKAKTAVPDPEWLQRINKSDSELYNKLKDMGYLMVQRQTTGGARPA